MRRLYINWVVYEYEQPVIYLDGYVAGFFYSSPFKKQYEIWIAINTY